MIKWLWPWVFFLLPLPLLVRYLLPRVKQVQQAALKVPFLEYFSEQAGDHKQGTPHRGLLLIAWLAWALFLIAAARPQWVGDAIELPINGRDLMVAIDLSESMSMEDFILNNRAVDRLTATKVVATDFIEHRVGDRIGLILFGDQAYLQTPLTFDRTTVKTLLLEAVIGLAGSRTAIGDAIGIAIKRLQSNPENQRVLILITDGANTAGEVQPLKAADIAVNAGLKIYTIGIGADEMVRRTFFGGAQRFNPSQDLDEKTLQAIADKTGGRYFRAHNTEELEKIYALLDKLEPTEQASQSFRPTLALFYWPLGIVLLFSAALTTYRMVHPE